MVLVTGATGTVGRKLVGELHRMGAQVRALSRDPRSARLPEGVQVVGGDLGRPDSLAPAVIGVDRVFMLCTGPARVAQEANLVAAAQRAGVARIVKLSALTVEDTSQHDAITRWHAAGELAVAESGLGWTFLRPGAFMSNALAWIPMVKHQGKVFAPFINVRTAAIDPLDVALAAARVLTEDGHEERAYALTGPELLGPTEQVERLGQVLGRSLELVEVPPQAARQRMLEAGMDAELADAVLATQANAGHGPGGIVTPTVAELTGRPARTFSDWAHEHAPLFRWAKGNDHRV